MSNPAIINQTGVVLFILHQISSFSLTISTKFKAFILRFVLFQNINTVPSTFTAQQSHKISRNTSKMCQVPVCGAPNENQMNMKGTSYSLVGTELTKGIVKCTVFAKLTYSIRSVNDPLSFPLCLLTFMRAKYIVFGYCKEKMSDLE